MIQLYIYFFHAHKNGRLSTGGRGGGDLDAAQAQIAVKGLLFSKLTISVSLWLNKIYKNTSVNKKFHFNAERQYSLSIYPSGYTKSAFFCESKGKIHVLHRKKSDFASRESLTYVLWSGSKFHTRESQSYFFLIAQLVYYATKEKKVYFWSVREQHIFKIFLAF